MSVSISWRHIHEYEDLMQDAVRMQAYHEAINAICPGKTVCEIGVGLGPLSLMALKAGAKKVYGIEVNADVLATAQEIIRQNGFDASRFVPLSGLSTNLSLPEKVDVILSETLDSMGIGEKTVDYMRDARERFLKPGGSFIPSKLDCFITLAGPSDYQSQMDFWRKDLLDQYDLDYSAIANRYTGSKLVCRVELDEIFGKWRKWQNIEFSDPSSFNNTFGTLIQIEKAGKITGFCCVFEAELAPGIMLSSFPDQPPTHWKQGFQAFPQSIDVQRGDLVCLDLNYQEIADVAAVQYGATIRHVPAADVRQFLDDNFGE